MVSSEIQDTAEDEAREEPKDNDAQHIPSISESSICLQTDPVKIHQLHGLLQ